MQLRNTQQAYGSVAKLFHWVLAFGIIGALAIGLYMEELDFGPDKLKLYGLHKSFGMIILGLVFIRLAWRLTNPAPLLPKDLKPYEKMGAHAAHWGLYLLMLAQPISGWIMSSSAGFPVAIFNTGIIIPDLVGKNHELHELCEEIHEIGANVFIALIVIHIGAALHHHIIRKDNVLKRMLPW